MEIIKKGCLPEERIYEATCSYCKTQIRFFQGEGIIINEQRDGSYICVQCPLCKKDIYKSI
jgi:hypothetical protein